MKRRRMTMTKYKITLKPIGKFFFGGDMRFSLNGDKNEYVSYIIQSMMFPQQTSLLGMLRFLILRNSKAFNNDKQVIVDKEEAKKLIGDRSFSMENKESNFGVISSISPCYLSEDNRLLLPELMNRKNEPFGAVKQTFSAIINETEKENVPYLDEYNAKNGTVLCFGNHSVSDIFKEDCRNGIDRDIETGKTGEKSLFKQISYQFKNDKYAFCFFANVNTDLTAYNNQIVSLGADSSYFSFFAEVATNEEIQSQKGKKIVLTSDAYIPSGEDLVTLCISETTPFKYLQTSVDKTEHYNRLNSKIITSNKANLYRKGSIFFFENEENCRDFQAIIEAQKNFRQIGYNYYTVK